MRVPISGIITTWPLAEKQGEKFRFDLGVTLANAQGNASQVRLNWHSKDPNDMATQDVYTEAVLRPQNWALAFWINELKRLCLAKREEPVQKSQKITTGANFFARL
jgi:hypothetical protein